MYFSYELDTGLFYDFDFQMSLEVMIGSVFQRLQNLAPVHENVKCQLQVNECNICPFELPCSVQNE